MAGGYKWLYRLGKLITLSIDVYEPDGVQMFACWCFRKVAESIYKHLKNKKQASIQLKKSEKQPLKKELKKKTSGLLLRLKYK